MPTFLQYLYVIGTFQGFLLSALLLFTPAVSHASRVLGIWCAFLAIGLMTVLVTQSEEIGSYGLLLGMTGFFLPVMARYSTCIAVILFSMTGFSRRTCCTSYLFSAVIFSMLTSYLRQT